MTHSLWIEPYLVELLRPMAEEGFPLIVAGGLGIYLKRRWVEQTRQQTLWTPLPDARATHDIDYFLALEIFQQDRVSRFRGTLARLGYQVHEKARYYQFIKPVTGVPVDHVKIDLHTRLPRDDEATQLKLQNHRLGRSGHRAFRTLHAWATPEAFAIDEGVQELPFAGSDPADIRFEGVVRVPNPFASLCMKLTAAGDYERTPIENRDPLQRKHAFDVFLLTAMLSESEVSQVSAFTRQFAGHAAMPAICNDIVRFFGAPDAPGCNTLRGLVQERRAIDLTRFCAVLRELFAA